jgi:hypothetical protein
LKDYHKRLVNAGLCKVTNNFKGDVAETGKNIISVMVLTAACLKGRRGSVERNLCNFEII